MPKVTNKNTNVTKDSTGIHVRPTDTQKNKTDADLLAAYLLLKNPTAKQTGDAIAAMIRVLQSWMSQ